MTERRFAESSFSRGWRDTVSGVKSFEFWALELLGGGILAATTSNDWAILYVVCLFVLLWACSTAVAPLRQRNEARAEIRRLKSASENDLSEFGSVLVSWESDCKNWLALPEAEKGYVLSSLNDRLNSILVRLSSEGFEVPKRDGHAIRRFVEAIRPYCRKLGYLLQHGNSSEAKETSKSLSEQVYERLASSSKRDVKKHLSNPAEGY